MALSALQRAALKEKEEKEKKKLQEENKTATTSNKTTSKTISTFNKPTSALQRAAQKEQEEKAGSNKLPASSVKETPKISASTLPIKQEDEDVGIWDAIRDTSFMPESWEDFGKGMAYNAERIGAGLLGFGEGITDFLGSTFYKGVEGVSSLGGLAPNKVSEWAGNASEKFLENSITQDYEKSIRERYNPTAAEETLSGVGQSVADVLASIATGKGAAKLVGKGIGIVDDVAEAAKAANWGKAAFGTRAAGSSATEAYDEGANTNQALLYGAGSGLTEVILESLSGGIPGFGSGVVTQAIQKVVSNPVVNKILDIAGEGGEEAASTIISPFLKRAIYDSDAELATADEIAESAIMGMITAGLLQGGIELPSYISARTQYNNQATQQDDDVVRSIIEEGLSTDQSSKSYKQAEKLKAKLEAGNSVTNKELNSLYRQNVKNVDVKADPDAILAEAAAEAVARETRAEAPQSAQESVSPAAVKVPSGAENITQAKASEQSVPYNVMSVNNQARKAVTNPGYGEVGTRTFAEIVEESGQSADQVRTQFQTAYELGKLEMPREKVSFESTIQESAYNAGRQDAILSMKKAEIKGATVWGKEGGLIQNEYSAKLDTRTTDTLQKIGKATGTKIIVEDIPAELNANGYYKDSDGTIHIDSNTTQPVMTVVKHELTHRMQSLAPKEYTQFRNYAVQAMSLYEHGNLTAVERMQHDYARRSDGRVQLSVEDAMDEIAANFTERILTDEKALNDFVSEVTKSEEHRTMGQKFFQAVREFIDKVKSIFKGDKAKMDQAARDEFGTTIAQLEKAEQLWKEAYRAAEKTANESGRAGETRDTMSYSMKEDAQNERGNELGTVSEGFGNRSPQTDGRGAEDSVSQSRRTVAAFARGNEATVKKGSGAEAAKRIIENAGGRVVVVKDHALQQYRENSRAVTIGDTVYLSDAITAEIAEVVGYHELVHLAKQTDSQTYVAFLNTTPSQLKKGTEDYDTLYDAAYSSRYGKRQISDLNMEQQRNVYDEINAIVYGFYKVSPNKASSHFADAFNDYDGYIRGLVDAVENQDQRAEAGEQYSLKDKDYMTAVESGDMETAQKMVDEAAKAAGYTIEAWHGTRAKERFTVFRTNEKSGNFGAHFTTNNPEGNPRNPANLLGGNGMYHVYLKAQNPFETFDMYADDRYWQAMEIDRLAEEIGTVRAEEIREELRKFYPLDDEEAGEEYRDSGEGLDDNQTETDMLENFMRELLEAGGYDSLAYQNEMEGTFGEEYDYVILNPEQIKSADPVEYDDNGNVIPLSERFNSENNDIRFSLKEGDERASYEENGTQYSLKSLRHDITEGKMFDDLVAAKVFTVKEAALLKENLNKLISYMIPNADILDMNESYTKDNRPFSSYKPNSDPLYKISLDFSTLCRKRLMTQYVIEQLQIRENRPMSAEEQIAIRSMLLDYRQQEKALQVACAMCYVEAARLKAPKQMENFFNDTESIMRKHFAKKDKAFNDKVKEAQAKFKVDRGYDANAANKDMKSGDKAALDKMSAAMRKAYAPNAEQQAIIDKAVSLPRSTFLTAANLTNLAIDHPEIYEAYTSHIRASTRSKSLEADVPYYYGDSVGPVSDSFIEGVNAENGMRFDSWSDFQMKHMLDMITAVIDLSVRKSKMHGYTKFPEMVRIFGKTGMMFNLSGVTEGNGFDADGNLVFSDTEGIDINEAIKLRKMFPETAGMQCIGVSDDHIRALLRSDFIDYVIPYHTSGMNATLRKMAGIHDWSNYEKTQHARPDPKAKKPANVDDKWQVEPVWSEFYVSKGKDGYDIMKKTAQRYVDMCHERGLIPKFDEFLDEDGYWKLLIDRKMINQETGEIIEQKPVKPIFDFDLIEQEIDREVSEYDPTLEQRALKYVVDNFDAVNQRIRDLKKAHPKKSMLKMGNEILQAYAEGSKRKEHFSLKIDTTGMSPEAKEIISHLRLHAMSSGYHKDKYASYSAERIERELRTSSADKEDYAKSYIAWVEPIDFLYATTVSRENRELIEEEAGTLDLEKLRRETQPIHLTVDFETGKIVGHEGRHRMTALSKAGVEKVAVIFDAWNDDRHNTKPIDMMRVEGQKFDKYHSGTDFYVHDMLPMSKRYADAIRQVFSQVGGSMQFSLKDQSDVMRDNAKLKAVNEALKEQFKTTKFAKVDQKELRKFARNLLKDYTSDADLDVTLGKLDSLYTFLANDDPAATLATEDQAMESLENSWDEFSQPSKWSTAYRMAYNIAEDVIQDASVLNDDMYQEYDELRNYLRTVGISMNKYYEHDLAGYENLNDFRKRNFGRIKITKDGLDVSKAYQELANRYPGLFNEEEHSHPGDQLTHLAEVLDSMEPIEENPFSYNMREATSWLANDIMERFFELPQAKPTFADKAQRKLTEQKIKDAKKLERVRTAGRERAANIIAEYREKVKETRKQEKAAKREAVAKVKDHYKAKEAKMSESRKAAVLRERISRHVGELKQRLLRPTDKKHIPQELQGAVAKLLESINQESRYEYAIGEDGKLHRVERGSVEGAEPTKRTQAFAELQSVYAQLANELTIDPDLLGDDGLLNDVIKLADKPMATMTSEELQIVWDTIRAVEWTVRTANKMHAAGRWATVSEAAEALREDNQHKDEKTELRGILGKGQKLTGLDMETPETYFHMLGKSGDNIFRSMRNAQDDHIRLMKNVADFTHKSLNDVDVPKLENELHSVILGGETVKLSTAQIMELYVLSKRKQAIDHIFVGGILPDVVSAKGLKKITKASPVRGVTPAEVGKAVSKLTEGQRKIADKLQEYASTELSKWGNQASMKVYGYEKFGEKNYWPIRVNRQEIKSDVQKDTAVTSLANRSFTKGTKPHANNSLRLGSIFDTFSTHSSEMATYAAWLGTLEDVNRIRNFTFKDEVTGHAVDTVKSIIDTVHGTSGNAYLDKLLADVTNGVKGTHGETAYMSSLVGNFKAAAVGANLRVIIQQPTAILRAADMIDPKHMATAGNPLSGWNKAKKYAPIAQWKDWGYFDINTGRQMKDVLFDSDTVLDKAKSISMWGAGAMDSVAWGHLWNAVESETKAERKTLKPGTESFYEAVAERFTEIVDHTQVVDGILQRSQIMRSADGVTKMATAFMGEPTKQYNMLMQAAYDAKHTNVDKRKAAMKHLARAATVLAISGIANSMAQAIIDAVRDDDKEKEYWEKLFASFKENLGSTFNPVAYVPFAKDVLSIFQGYDVSRMDMESIEKVVSAGQNMMKALSGEGKHTVGGAAINLIAEVARLVGLPVSNLKREITTFSMLAAVEADNYLMQYRMEKWLLNMNNNGSSFVGILYNAYVNDKAAYKIIYDDMVKSGYDPEKIKSAMETRMKKDQGVTKVEDMEQRYMSPKQQAEFDSKMKPIKSNGIWKSATAEQRDNLEDRLYNLVSGTGKAQQMSEELKEMSPYGIDETEYLLYKLALEMYDTPNKSGELGGTPTNAEKAAAIQAMGNLSGSEIAALWDTDKGYEAYAGGVDMVAYIDYLGDGGTVSLDKMIEAQDYDISTTKYLDFLDMLDKYDQPTESGNYGSFTQDEATAAIAAMTGLTRDQKAYLWQSVNKGWNAKNNPWK